MNAYLVSISASLLALMALASCGAGSHKPRQDNEPLAMDHANLAAIKLTSNSFGDGQPIPTRFTCDGGDQVPMLDWDEPPSSTRSFALVVDDPDAPGGTFRHWGIFNIPPSARSLGPPQFSGSQVTNDFGNPGYGGPCPPKGRGPHHYHFKLFALNVDRLDLAASAKIVDVEHAARRHAIASGELIGTYERP